MEQTIPFIAASALDTQNGQADTSLIQVVLIDQPVVRHGIRIAIHQEFDIEVVGEGNDIGGSLQKVQRLQPDVLLMDIDFSGAKVIRQVYDVSPRTAVIVFTSCEREEQMLEALEAGAKGYILKCIEVDEILAAIRTVSDGEICITPSMASKLVDSYLKREKILQTPDAYDRLSRREREVLSLLAEGHSHHVIAEQLHVSPYTIQTYRQRIMRKLDIHSGTELLRYAFRKGIIRLES